jgi:Papain family cysteine protease
MVIEVLCDLRHRFGPARDQGTRPTCLAFAASDAHAALRDPWGALSCEFAFYHAQRRAGRSPTSGALLPQILEALKEDGQPVENDWPYLATLPSDLAVYQPPGNVVVFRRDGEPQPPTLDQIIEHLNAKNPTVMLMMLSDAFYAPDVLGVVPVTPGEGPDLMRRHAVVAVGHGTVDGVRAVLVRNSWGPEWGIEGHAWLTEAFIAPRLTRIALLTEEIHVPSQDLAA